MKLTRAIASITKGFSFAYIQEAFVAALLAIAGEEEEEEDEENAVKAVLARVKLTDSEDLGIFVADDDNLDRYVLWRQIKIHVKHLRAELGAKE